MPRGPPPRPPRQGEVRRLNSPAARCAGTVATAMLCLGAAPAARPAMAPRIRAGLVAQARVFDRAHRFDAVNDPAGGPLVARNPDQGLELRFSESGVEVALGAERGAPLGLRLVRAGAAAAAAAPVPGAEAPASGSRDEYRTGEPAAWYGNGEAGLEQGFTFERSVPGATELALELELGAGGSASIGPGARDAVLRDAGGAARLGYRALRAFDAEGRELDARLEAEASRLRIVARVEGAAYPVTIDPLLAPFQVRRLEPFQPNAYTGDEFGTALSASGDGSTLVVGAPLADRDPELGDGIDLGQAYVYRRSRVGLSWEIAARLDASDASAGRALGQGVAVSDDGATIAVGAPGAAGGAGRVYVYRRPAGGWSGQRSPDQTLLASDAAVGADFGWAVALEGSLLTVGAPSATVSAQAGAGAGYLFQDSGTSFAQVAKLTSASPQAMALLGDAVASSGDWIALGEPARDAGASVDAGAVALYAKPAPGWANAVPTQLVPGPANGSELGRSVAIEGTLLVAGLPGHSGSRGRLRLYERSGNSWSLSATLKSSTDVAGDRFGASVAVVGTTVVAGAPGVGSSEEGMAFVFERPAGGWSDAVAPQAQLSVGENGGELGSSVALSSSWLVAGSVGSDAFSLDAGAVLGFRRPATGWATKSTEDALLGAYGFDAWTDGEFGTSVALDGETLVVGHPRDGFAGSEEGSAYVFVRSAPGDTWEIAARLVASPANPFSDDERFGTSVAVDGNVIVVGAPLYDLFHSSSDEGVAFVFTKPPGGWSGTLLPSARLQASNPNPFDANEHVGISVAIDGDVIAVGADSYELVKAASDEGAVFVYRRPVGGWSGTLMQDARLTASVPNPFNGPEGLGHSVAIEGDVIVAGADLYDFASANSNEGAAFVFVKPAGGWSGNQTEAARLQASVPNPFNNQVRFGHAVDLSGDTIVVGADSYDLVSSSSDEGVAFVFVRPAGGWSGQLTENAQLRASVPNPHGNDEFFASSVAIEGDRVVVGALSYDVSGSGSDDGAVFVYDEPGAGWSGILTQDAMFTASDTVPGDELGSSVALAGQTLVAGAQLARSGGVSDSGAAYVFTLPTTHTFSGVAAGGTIQVTLAGVSLVVVTTSGMSSASVAAAVAAAIVANPTLAAAGITATASGTTVQTNGEVEAFVVDDPGLGPAKVPSLGAFGAALTALLMGATGVRNLERSRRPAA